MSRLLYIHKPHTIERKRYFVTEAMLGLMAIYAVVAEGIYAGVSAGQQASAATKERNAQHDLLGAAPKAPDATKAEDTAQDTLTQNRRTLLASGGNTDVTGGAPILQGNTKSNVLLGA
jgi:UDP-N-acetylmuramate-alanine ligase